MVCLGCLHLAGGPVAMLQTVAWVTMLASYSAENGLVRGAHDTFSGDRPCGLCKTLAAVKQPDPDVPDPLPGSGFTQLKMFQDMVPPRVIGAAVIRGVGLPSPGFVGPLSFLGNEREAPPIPPP